jgi:hypothetical protein
MQELVAIRVKGLMCSLPCMDVLKQPVRNQTVRNWTCGNWTFRNWLLGFGLEVLYGYEKSSFKRSSF